MYAFLDLKINDYILLNFILFIYLLFLTGPQGQQCYTLMGFSILYKNSLLLLLLLLLLLAAFTITSWAPPKCGALCGLNLYVSSSSAVLL